MVNGFRMVVRGWKDLRLYSQRLKRKTPGYANDMTSKQAHAAYLIAKTKIGRGGSGSGDLVNSLKITQDKLGYKLSAGQGLTRPYAYYQEYGFSAHTVAAKNWGGPKPMSKFKMRVAKFYPYMGPAWRRISKRGGAYLDKVIRKMMRA